MLQFRITSTPIRSDQLRDTLEDTESGGTVVFEGRVRRHNQGKPVTHLEYEAFPALAEKEGMRILHEAAERWPIRRAMVQHRTGSLALGEVAVWVGVAAPHRDAAFQACRYIIDELKSRVPIWKKEHYQDSSTHWIEGGG